MSGSADIVTDDFCRACRGTKGRHEYDTDSRGRQVRVWEPCFHCRGTGKQTVRVGE